MNKLLLKNGKVVDPVAGKTQKQDILITKGQIKEIATDIKANEAVEIELDEKVVLPGLVDMHVHLREPGFEPKETIATGTEAAVNGGFTTVAAMPNTKPVIDNASLVESVYSKAEPEAQAKVYQIGAITKGSAGKELAEIGKMAEAGIIGISDDGQTVMNSELMRLAFEYSQNFNLPVITHCEDENLSGTGVVNKGYYSTVTGLDPIPASAEEVIVARDICLAERTGAHLHIAHVSTAGSVKLIREAKSRGVNVTCEVTPHHFTLTDKEVTSFDPATKVNPPLRSQADIQAIKAGLKDGTIDVIATDHAPHTREEKNVEYDYAPFGISGLETAFGLVITELVKPGILSLETAVAKLSAKPAEILGLNAGRLVPGTAADITVVDIEKDWQVEATEFKSKGKNTPFTDFELTGQPVMTIVEGQIVKELPNY